MQCSHSSPRFWEGTKVGKNRIGPFLEPANGSCDVKPPIKGIHAIQSGEELLLLEVGVKSTLGVVLQNNIFLLFCV